jgi:hypothetical protein
MKRHVLNSKEPADFGLLGIITPVKDYRICWLLNNHLEFDLVKCPDLTIPKATSGKKTASLFQEQTGDIVGLDGFSCYCYEIEENQLTYYLISNRNDYGYLMPELKTSDYFLLLQGIYTKKEIEELKQKISGIPSVIVASIIDTKKLKSKNNLVF